MNHAEMKEGLLTGKALIKRMAQEFLEERLSIEASRENIRRFAAHIIAFEKEVAQRTKRKNLINHVISNRKKGATL